MPLTKDDIKTDYPLPVYNYRVEIGSAAVAFSEVSGLSIAYETSTYKESPTAGGAPGPRVMIMPAQRNAAKVTLKKGIVRGASLQQLYGWIKTIAINQIEKKDIFVRLCDENGAAAQAAATLEQLRKDHPRIWFVPGIPQDGRERRSLYRTIPQRPLQIGL